MLYKLARVCQGVKNFIHPTRSEMTQPISTTLNTTFRVRMILLSTRDMRCPLFVHSSCSCSVITHLFADEPAPLGLVD